MYRYKAILLFAALLISCSRNDVQQDIAQKEIEEVEAVFQLSDYELHALVNGLLQSDSFSYDAGIVVLQTNDVKLDENYLLMVSGDTVHGVSGYPVWEFRYKKSLLEGFAQQGYLDTIEAEYMFEQIKPNLTVTLDSAQLLRKGINYDKLSKFFTDKNTKEGYKRLEKETGAKEYIMLSTPLITEDKTKALIRVNGYCGRLCGSGILYLLEKVENQWQVIYYEGIFVS